MRIWRCPSCGAGKRAPDSLPRVDVRRYCLTCSEQSGRLTERVPSGAERRAEAGRRKAATTRQRKAAAAERERVRREVVRSSAGPINVVRQADKWAARLPALRSSYPEIVLRRRREPGCSGHAGSYRAVLSIGEGSDPASIYELILHELAHTVDPDDWHGKAWRQTLLSATRQAFPGIKGLGRSLKGHRYNGISRRVREAIAAHLEAGGRIKHHVKEAADE